MLGSVVRPCFTDEETKVLSQVAGQTAQSWVKVGAGLLALVFWSSHRSRALTTQTAEQCVDPPIPGCEMGPVRACGGSGRGEAGAVLSLSVTAERLFACEPLPVPLDFL